MDEFAYRLNSAPASRSDGCGCVDHDIEAVYREADSEDAWVVVPAHHTTITLPAADIATVMTMDDSTGPERTAKNAAYKQLMLDNFGLRVNPFDTDAVMGAGGRVEAIQRLGRHVHGTLEAERPFRSADVVVDGFGNADDGHPSLSETARDAHRPVAPDDHKAVKTVPREHRQGVFAPIRSARLAVNHLVPLERICRVARPEDCPAEGQNVRDGLPVEPLGAVAHQPVVAVQESDDLRAVLVHKGLGDGADDGVQARTIPAASQNADAICLFCHRAGPFQDCSRSDSRVRFAGVQAEKRNHWP